MPIMLTHHAQVQPLPRLELERILVVVDGIEVLLEELILAAILTEETIVATLEDCAPIVVILEQEEIVATLEEESIP